MALKERILETGSLTTPWLRSARATINASLGGVLGGATVHLERLQEGEAVAITDADGVAETFTTLPLDMRIHIGGDQIFRFRASGDSGTTRIIVTLPTIPIA